MMKDGACVPPPQCIPPSVMENGECVCKPPSVIDGSMCVCKPPRQMKNGTCVKQNLLVQITVLLWDKKEGLNIKGIATPNKKVQVWLDGQPMDSVRTIMEDWNVSIPPEKVQSHIEKTDVYIVEAEVIAESDGEYPSLDYRPIKIEIDGPPKKQESTPSYGGVLAIRGLLEADFPPVQGLGLSLELNRRLGASPFRLGVAVISQSPELAVWIVDLRVRADLDCVQAYLLGGAGRNLRYGLKPPWEFVPIIFRFGGGLSYAYKPGLSIGEQKLKLELGLEANQEWQLPRRQRSLEWTGFMGMSL